MPRNGSRVLQRDNTAGPRVRRVNEPALDGPLVAQEYAGMLDKQLRILE